MQCFSKKDLVRLIGIIFLTITTMSLISCSNESIVVTEETKIEDIKKEIKHHFLPSEDTERLINEFVGKDLIDISLEDISGNNINLTELGSDHKEFILEFMAPWCPACINTVNDLKEINQDIKVVNIALNAENFDEVDEFKETADSDLEYFLTKDNAADIYNIMYIPTAFYVKDNVIWGVFDSLNSENISTIREITEGV